LEKLNDESSLSSVSDDVWGYLVLAIITLTFVYYATKAVYSSCCFARKKTITNEKLEKIKLLPNQRKIKSNSLKIIALYA
jgi:hypothetical protein